MQIVYAVHVQVFNIYLRFDLIGNGMSVWRG